MDALSTLAFGGVDFEIRQGSSKPAQYLFGVRKSGSSIMNAMAASLAKMNGVTYVDVPGRLFAAGVKVSFWQRNPDLGALLAGGNVYGGFRNAPIAILDHPVARDAPQALLVRDPRDALVSEYFSNAFSHSIPGDGETRELMLQERSKALQASVADYAIRMAPALRTTLREYLPFLDLPGMKVYRYEQAIMDKAWFLEDLCTHFGWQVTATQLGQILGWADVMPADENPAQFVRKVRPGDHLEKLDRRAIETLNDVFVGEMARFGYQRTA